MKNRISITPAIKYVKRRHAGLDPASNFFADSGFRRNDVGLGYLLADAIISYIVYRKNRIAAAGLVCAKK